MSQKTARAKLLDELLGEGTTARVEEATKAAQGVLDAAGVQRKEANIVDRAQRAWRRTFGRANGMDMYSEYKQRRLQEAGMAPKKKGLFSSRDESRADALISAVEKWTGELEALDDQWAAAIQADQDASGIDRERRSLEGKIADAERELESIGFVDYTKERRAVPAKPGVVARIKTRLAALGHKAEGEGGEAKPEGDAAPVLEVLAAVGATEVSDAVKRIHEALSKAGVLEAVVKAAGSEEDLSNILAMAIAGGAASKDDQQAQQANAATADQQQVVTQPAAVKALKEQLRGFIADSTQDIGAIARSQLALTEQQLDFEERLKQLESRVGDSPRRASQDPATEVTDPKLAKELQAQLGEIEIIAGLRVLKEAPNGSH